MGDSSLLLVSAIKEDQTFASEAARVGGLSLLVEPDPVAASNIIANQEVGAIFVDGEDADRYQTFEQAIQNNVGIFSDRVNANVMHYLSSKDIDQVPYLFQSPIFGHYIRRNYSDVKEAGSRYGIVVAATLQNRAFGLQSLLPEKTKVQVVRFKSTTQKQEGVEAVKNFLLSARFKSRMATVIANAVDELIMNAMFDAPIDELGNPLYLKTPRNTEITLEEDRGVEMHIGYDRQYVAITAVDYFGSLDKAKLFSHISKRYVEEEYKVKTTVAGAGIGLATVFRSGGSFFFSCENRVKTEVTVFFRRADNFRDFKDQFRFLSTQFYF